jgi:hypothetical protein
LTSDTTAEFFNGLARRGYEPGLADVSGTALFDLTHDGHVDHWFVEVRNERASR